MKTIHVGRSFVELWHEGLVVAAPLLPASPLALFLSPLPLCIASSLHSLEVDYVFSLSLPLASFITQHSRSADETISRLKRYVRKRRKQQQRKRTEIATMSTIEYCARPPRFRSARPLICPLVWHPPPPLRFEVLLLPSVLFSNVYSSRISLLCSCFLYPARYQPRLLTCYNRMPTVPASTSVVIVLPVGLD